MHGFYLKKIKVELRPARMSLCFLVLDGMCPLTLSRRKDVDTELMCSCRIREEAPKAFKKFLEMTRVDMMRKI
mgnify:CR=1 FL=1